MLYIDSLLECKSYKMKGFGWSSSSSRASESSSSSSSSNSSSSNATPSSSFFFLMPRRAASFSLVFWRAFFRFTFQMHLGRLGTPIPFGFRHLLTRNPFFRASSAVRTTVSHVKSSMFCNLAGIEWCPKARVWIPSSRR